MKLRIRDNSIRMRLDRAEVHRLVEVGWIQKTTYFPRPVGSSLTYLLKTKAGASPADCMFEQGRLAIQLSTDVVRRWATNAQVGIQAELAVGMTVLKILVEKDFECLHGTAAGSQEGAYPNPMVDTR
jgi:hypothetical protein